MAGYRKLGRTASQRKALLRNQVSNLLYHGKIRTTDTKAKEIRKIAESFIALAVKERDNYDTVTVTSKVARKDMNGGRVKEEVDGKKVTVFDNVEKEIKKDKPSRLAARRKCPVISTGESVGQVASQTLQSIKVINEVTNTPIISERKDHRDLRPRIQR